MPQTQADIVWVLLCAGIMFLMQAGFLCLEAGLTRAKNSIDVALKNLIDFGISALLFWAVGFGLMFGVSAAGWIGASHFAPDLPQDAASFSAFFLFQLMFCSTSVTILSGAVAERMKFTGYLLVCAITSVAFYPLLGHWAWGGMLPHATGHPGWLRQLGFVDFAGSTVVHGTGGWVSLATVLVIGPRRGWFENLGGRSARPAPSNLPMAMLGVMLLWFGWVGFNGGSTLKVSDRLPAILTNTMVAGASALIVGLIAGRWLRRAFDSTTIINAPLAGLVSITAGCHAVTTRAAIVIGAVGAVVFMAGARELERRKIDDTVGAISVHALAGVWGTLAVAIFGDPVLLATGLPWHRQILAQFAGILTCFAFCFGGAYALLRAINRFVPLRVSAEAEDLGLNVSEHSARSDLYDLVTVMDAQAKSGDFALRAPATPFTEVGQIAQRYNEVLDSLQDSEQKLRGANARLSEMAVTDALTGIPNHRAFQQRIRQLVAEGQRGRRFAMVMADLDHFKKFNDTYGHPVGDQILIAVAKALSAGVRQMDFVARYGGEEFAILFPDVATEQAVELTERLRLAVATLPVPGGPITMSFGVCVWTRDMEIEGLIRAADAALYKAKEQGRNRVVAGTPTVLPLKD